MKVSFTIDPQICRWLKVALENLTVPPALVKATKEFIA